LAVSSIHVESPYGWPRRTLVRSDLSSFAVRASLTRAIQLGRRAIGHVDRTLGFVFAEDPLASVPAIERMIDDTRRIRTVLPWHDRDSGGKSKLYH